MFIDESKKDTILSRLEKIDNNDFETIKYFYEKKLKHKDLIISQLKNKFKEEREKCLNNEKKYQEIDNQYVKFLEGKDKITDMLKYLQENLLLSQKTIENLEKINSVKEKNLLNLQKEIIDQEERISSLVQEIDTLQKEINELNSVLQLSNDKNSNSFFQRIFK